MENPYLRERSNPMDVKEALRSMLQEMILPELDHIKTEQVRINERINSVDSRLNDINAHLVDQSRRIDETNKRIDETNKRIDETNKRIDSVRDELVSMIRETNKRMDRLYEVIVRREEHDKLEARLSALETKVGDLERRIAA